MEDDSDDDGSENERDSSEGEDWEDGNTLVSKFMEADQEFVSLPHSGNDAFLTRFHIFSGPQNTEDDLLNLVESLKGQHSPMLLAVH